MSRLDRARTWIAVDRGRSLVIAIAAAVTVLSAVWFFTARDERGRTARLTADAWYYHAYLPSLVLDRDLDFRDQYRITHNWYRLGDTERGRPSNVFGIGPAVFELPLFLTGHGLARVAGSDANGFSRPEVEASLLASLLYSLGALGFAFSLLRRRLGDRAAAVAGPLLLACAGPVVYYAIRQPGYAHPFATFWVAWLVWAWDRSFDRTGQEPGPRAWSTWLGLGALVGAAALARPQCGLWAVLFVPAVIDDLRRGPDWRRALRRAAPRWAAGAAVALLVFGPQLLAWKAIYGHYLTTPQGPGFMRWDSPAWSEVLFSSRNGLLPWAPLYAIAGLGLLASVRRTPRLSLALVAGVAVQVVTNGAVWDWWAGGSFGGRRFDSTFIAFAYGLGYLLVSSAPAVTRPLVRRVRAGLAIAIAAVALVLATGNLILAARTSAPTARIHGGVAAHEVLRAQLPDPVAPVVAWFSAAANLPARVAFAVGHDTGLATYDRVVGVHVLGELYPGLNSFQGKLHERVPLDRPEAARLLGARPGIRPASVTVGQGPVRILLGLNRRGPIDLTLRAGAPDGDSADVALEVEGRTIAQGVVTPAGGQISGRLNQVRRGVNEVVVRAPPGTSLYWLDVRAQREPARR